ncbi:Deacetylase PdaC domain-containing protein [Sphingomonas antarctica]|uniref:DUF4163 domain-containing protein n=1 Tax=Sphingomonas antarctica TaxID=2040274 RepID=UPI0039EA3DD8
MRFVPVVFIAMTCVAAAEPAYKFSYAYPAQARAIPPLRAWLEADKARGRTKFAAEAMAAQREAKKDGFPYHPYDADMTWQVVTDTPRFLSLSRLSWAYTGGAHGNSGYDSLLWDKATRMRRQPADVFADPKALYASVRKSFCDLLDRERSKRRGEPVVRGKSMFDDCIDPAQEVLILGSSGGGRINRIGFLIAPYNAGSYAEGTYEVTLPVTPAILARVKPQYRGAFAVGR